MASPYETNMLKLKQDILAQKTIYKFRNFLYSANKDIRYQWFELCRRYLENEYRNNAELSVTEKDRLLHLVNYWQWEDFQNNSTNWWYILSMNHSHSTSLMTLMHLWIDDIDIFDPDAFETSTFGIR